MVSGETVAVSPQHLKSELENRGLRAQNINIKRKFIPAWNNGKFKPEEFMMFVQEMVSLLRAGLPLTEVLLLSSDRPSSPELGQIISRVLQDVRDGALLSEAFGNQGEVFDPLFLAALKIGEKSGELPSVLIRYQEFLRRKVALRKKISQAMAYPLFLLIALAVILGVLFAFVMPRFVSMYANFDAQLPAPTQVLLSIVNHFPYFAAFIVGLLTSCWLLWRRFVATTDGLAKIHRLKLYMPVWGKVEQTSMTAYFARALATLLSGGTPLLEALRVVRDSFPNLAYAQRIASTADLVLQGESLTIAARSAHLLPETALKMIQVGEKSGSLDNMLFEIAQYYEEMLENKLGRFMSLIEPALIAVMGLLIGGIIIVMYLPIFNLAEVIR